MDINQGIAQQAGELAEKHALKGFDGLHLACYLALRSLVAEEVEFSSFDSRARRGGPCGRLGTE